MFRLLDNPATLFVEIELDGAVVELPQGISLAAALLYLDAVPLRDSIVDDAPRAPYCMMGLCFDCLVEIDGVENQRACQVEVQPGLRVRRQLRPGAVPGDR